MKLFNRRFEIGIILYSILIYGVVMSLPIKAKKFGDMDFHVETKAIASYLHGNESLNVLSITKAPGPVLYYVIPYYLAGSEADANTYWLWGVAWTAVIATITLLLIYKAIDRKFGLEVANVFVLLIFVIPLHVYYSMGILAESLAFLGVCWVIIGLLQKTPGSRFYFFYTIGIAALVLARPNAGLVIPLTICCGFYLFWRSRDERAKAVILSSFGAFALIVGVTLAVKSLPNKRATLKQEEYLSFVMHHGRFQFRTESFDWRFWDNKTRPDSKDYQAWLKSTGDLNDRVNTDSLPYAEVYYGWVLQDVLDHPFMLARQFVVRLIFGNTLQVSSRSVSEFTLLGFKGPAVFWTFHIIINLLNYSIVGLAIYYIATTNVWKGTWLLLAVVLALLVFHGLIYMEQRYLFPLRPIIVLWASLGLISLVKRV